MKRVLLTGAGGFIGRHCVPLLKAAGYDVHGITTRSRIQGEEGLIWHQVDLFDAKGIHATMAEVRPTHLLHLAWITEPGRYWSSPENLRWVQASLELLQAFRDHGGERVVMAGSCAEYDWEYGYCREATTPLRPATPYGSAKHALQSLLAAYCASSGLSGAWGRVFFLYGPHERPERLVPSVIRSLLVAEPALCTHGNQIRDFLHVEDVASAFAALLESRHEGPANIGSGRPLALRDLVDAIAVKIGRPELVKFGAVAAPENEPRLLVADPTVLEGLGWQPRHSLDSGIEQTIEWWRQRKDMSR